MKYIKKLTILSLSFLLLCSTSISSFAEETVEETSTTETSEQSETEIIIEETETSENLLEFHACTCFSDYSNIAYHEDDCDLKVYIIDLIEDQTAYELFNDWSRFDETIKKNILDYLSVEDVGIYNDLVYLIEQEEGLSATVDGIHLNVKGTPAGVYMNVTSVADEDFSEEAKDIMKDDAVFALDFEFNDNVKTWQPVLGQLTEVILDANSLNLNENELVHILHESDDGTLTSLGIYPVENGTISFKTSSFSNFYGYTVDFNYGDNWYSIPGGSSILLSDLLRYIEADFSIYDVKDISFSDSNLIEILYLPDLPIDETNTYDDWVLNSKEAFNTQEILNVTLVDNTVKTIYVYDAVISGELTTNTTLNNGDVIEGLTINSDVTLTLNGTVSVKGTINVASGTLTINGSGTLKRADEFLEAMISVTSNGELVINGESTDNRIIINGQNDGATTFAYKPAIYSEGNVSLTNTNVINNAHYGVLASDAVDSKIATSGGGIRLLSLVPSGEENQLYDPKTLTMKNCEISGNLASATGGGLFVRGQVIAENVDIINNSVLSDSRYNLGRGGGIYIENHATLNRLESTLTNVDICNNISMQYGAGGQFATGANVHFISGSVSNNESLCAGAAGLHITQQVDYRMDDVEISKNTAAYMGGGIHSSFACNLYLNGGSINNNIATRGGAISIDMGTTLNLDGTLIDSNEARIMSVPMGHGYPDGVYHATTNPNASSVYTVDYINKTYTQNSGLMVSKKDEDGIGGGIFVDASICNLRSSTISNNIADAHGGGFSLTMSIADDNIDSIALQFNMTGGEIIKNSAGNHADIDGNGGGIYLEENRIENSIDIPTFTLTTGEISENTTDGNGGGIYVAAYTHFILKDEESSNPIQITKNEAKNGGGIYIHLTENDETTLTGGIIEENIATENGGGFYIKGSSSDNSKTINYSGSVKVSENQAKNGGGFYIEEGKLTVSDGIITKNKATSSKTTLDTSEGVGGGIYLKKGNFTLSGSNVGIHSNTADAAANDVYSSGSDTTVVLPDVHNMNLTEWPNADAHPDGWYADYMENDTSYPSTILGSANPGRYNFDNVDSENLEVEATTLSAHQNAYYCLTIGAPYPSHGSIVIEKVLDKEAKEDTTFIFEISGRTRKPQYDYNMRVALKIEKGQTQGTVTIYNIPTGYYTIKELTDNDHTSHWSWRYKHNSKVFYPTNDTNNPNNTELQVLNGKLNWVAEFNNTYTQDLWLSDEDYNENTY